MTINRNNSKNLQCLLYDLIIFEVFETSLSALKKKEAKLDTAKGIISAIFFLLLINIPFKHQKNIFPYNQ